MHSGPSRCPAGLIPFEVDQLAGMPAPERKRHTVADTAGQWLESCRLHRSGNALSLFEHQSAGVTEYLVSIVPRDRHEGDAGPLGGLDCQ